MLHTFMPKSEKNEERKQKKSRIKGALAGPKLPMNSYESVPFAKYDY